jgi:hypothetical protein
MKRWMIAAALIAVLAFATAPAASAKSAMLSPETNINRGVVQLETSRAAGISVRITEDLANRDARCSISRIACGVEAAVHDAAPSCRSSGRSQSPDTPRY